jgi:transcriptional repressor NrdR
VVDSRPAEGGTAIRRRRECLACGHRFTTYEQAVVTVTVQKRSGVVEPFDARKLRRGLESALADRPVPSDTVETMVRDIETEGKASGQQLTTDDIGRLVLQHLRQVDEVAYLRFASVYKEFQGAQDFEREMAALEAEE